MWEDGLEVFCSQSGCCDGYIPLIREKWARDRHQHVYEDSVKDLQGIRKPQCHVWLCRLDRLFWKDGYASKVVVHIHGIRTAVYSLTKDKVNSHSYVYSTDVKAFLCGVDTFDCLVNFFACRSTDLFQCSNYGIRRLLFNSIQPRPLNSYAVESHIR